MWKLNAVISAFILLCTLYSVYKLPQIGETFTTDTVHREYLSQQQVVKFLADDQDGYVQLMSTADLHARRSSSVQEYLEKISKAASEFTDAEKFWIDTAIRKVDAYLSSNPKLPKYISARKLHDIPWKIGLTKGNVYEDGLPHTRQDVIFITRKTLMSRYLASTLLHEKVHIYERMYPDDVAKWMQIQGYQVWKPRREERLARSNPDLDPYIYIDRVSKRPMITIYKSDKPHNISDVIQQNASSEHPYETLAYEIGNSL